MIYLSLNARIVWMNELYSVYTKRSMEKHFMVPTIYELLQMNLSNTFLVENLRDFLTKKGEKFQFSSFFLLKYGGKGECKFEVTRIDTEKGVPLLYSIEVTPYSFEE